MIVPVYIDLYLLYLSFCIYVFESSFLYRALWFELSIPQCWIGRVRREAQTQHLLYTAIQLTIIHEVTPSVLCHDVQQTELIMYHVSGEN